MCLKSIDSLGKKLRILYVYRIKITYIIRISYKNIVYHTYNIPKMLYGSRGVSNTSGGDQEHQSEQLLP